MSFKQKTLDAIVVGAGMTGIQCARTLAMQGQEVVVLERSRDIGGRCATRSLYDSRDGDEHRMLRADFGPVFIHGSDPDFLAWVQEAGGIDLIPGWPAKVFGRGKPCQPAAFEPHQKRFGLREGVKSLLRADATMLDIHFERDVISLGFEDGRCQVQTQKGETYFCKQILLCCATEQTRNLLATVHGLQPAMTKAVAGMQSLVGMFRSLPSLTVIAHYGPEMAAHAPAWDVWYPEQSDALLVVSNETSKRGLPPQKGQVLLFQARPGWSAERMDQNKEAWAQALLSVAADEMGSWVQNYKQSHAHRWKYGRLDPSDELARPLLVELEEGVLLGVAGDLFNPGGGLQAAWCSGRELARMVADKTGARRTVKQG